MFGHQDENETNTSNVPTPAPQLPSQQTTDGYVAAPVAPVTAPAVTPEAAAPQSAPAPNASTDALLDLKQQALQHLSPLVGQLDQSPEEKFRTTMMLIQASDNHDLLKDALAAAKQISDDKQRAQALLDVINEINYFTQQNSSTSAAS